MQNRQIMIGNFLLKMKNIIIVLSFLVTIFFHSSVAADEDMYTTKYDNMDVDAILVSKRMRDSYINCFMDQGKCTPAGDEVKRNLPEALETQCRKCSEKQKENVKKIIQYLYEKEPESFKLMLNKYDPDGKYQKQAKEYLATHNGKFE